MLYGDCERGRRDLGSEVGSGMLVSGLPGYGLGGGFSHSFDFGYGGFAEGGSGVGFEHVRGFHNSVNISNVRTEMNNASTNNFCYTEPPGEDILRGVPDTVENHDPGFKEGGGGYGAEYKDSFFNEDGVYYNNSNGDGSFGEGGEDFDIDKLIVTL